jgi:hypothetical protein
MLNPQPISPRLPKLLHSADPIPKRFPHRETAQPPPRHPNMAPVVGVSPKLAEKRRNLSRQDKPAL